VIRTAIVRLIRHSVTPSGLPVPIATGFRQFIQEMADD
jgi:hypothetical protein